jgi:hypothetical protein
MSDWKPIATMPAMEACEVAKFPAEKPETWIMLIMSEGTAHLAKPAPTHWRPVKAQRP